MAINKTDVEALLGITLDQAHFDAAIAAVHRAIDSYLPAGLRVAELSDVSNLARVDDVALRVVLRLIANPAGAQQVATESLMTGFQGGEGVGTSPLTLRRSEKDILNTITPEGDEGTARVTTTRHGSFDGAWSW